MLVNLREACALDLGDLVGQHQPDLGVFVADVDVDLVRLHDPGGDQHAFDEAVRVLLEIVAVLEGAGLALVGVHRHQARRRLGAHQRPLAAGREAGAAEPAQPGVADDLDEVVARARAVESLGEQAIAAVGEVVLEIDVALPGVRVLRHDRGPGDAIRRRAEHLHVADRADRRALAGAHARRAHHAHVRPELARQRLRATSRRPPWRRTASRRPAP